MTVGPRKKSMRLRSSSLVAAMLVPGTVVGQSPASRAPVDAVMLQFARFADIFGSRLVAAFDSIPANRYDYKPTPKQQSIGYIAQHLENANYSLCERFGDLKYRRTGKDSLADTLKARWPKDTLVARLKRSLDFCDTAIERAPRLESPTLASNLLAFETDLAEHYSQLAVYMRLLGMVPPSALPPRARTAIELPVSALSTYVGFYEIVPGLEFDVTLREGALFVRPTMGGPTVRLWPESTNDFFVKEVDAQITFTRDANGNVSGLVLHQFGRDRTARKVK
jgi:hypothetical protein